MLQKWRLALPAALCEVRQKSRKFHFRLLAMYLLGPNSLTFCFKAEYVLSLCMNLPVAVLAQSKAFAGRSF